MQIEVTTYYLEMKSPDELCPSQRASSKPEILQVAIPAPELNRFLYTAVGAAWYWIDRLELPGLARLAATPAATNLGGLSGRQPGGLL